MEVERARLLSLAIDFGFNEDEAKKCLDGFVDLYGEDGKEFVTVEHCGDDFLAALADSVQENEDWDDLQAIESEACGVLNSIFEEEYANNAEEAIDGDVPQRFKKENPFMHWRPDNLNSSSSFTNDVDSDLEVLNEKDIIGRHSTFDLKKGQAHLQCPLKESLNSKVSRLFTDRTCPLKVTTATPQRCEHWSTAAPIVQKWRQGVRNCGAVPFENGESGAAKLTF
ncbi:hypothetical protein M5K25_027527 [Dendrobium thyrsiflorum]|uniref:Uncharacterized protein n=1 Tax=Dendrobium thyrsiflorum TaxID=117978 RepID=A0ABD0TU20_DENTH